MQFLTRLVNIQRTYSTTFKDHHTPVSLWKKRGKRNMNENNAINQSTLRQVCERLKAREKSQQQQQQQQQQQFYLARRLLQLCCRTVKSRVESKVKSQ